MGKYGDLMKVYKFGDIPVGVETRGIFGYKKWSKEVRERDNYTCQICGENNRRMVAHHLESYDTNENRNL